MNPFALPVHPIAVHFPLAMLAAAWVCMLVRYFSGSPQWDDRVQLFEFIGVVTLPVAIVAGFVDTRGLGPLAEFKWDQPLIWHVVASLVASLVFAGHLLWRRRNPFALSARNTAIDVGWLTAGLWLLVIAGSIAGEMVYA